MVPGIGVECVCLGTRRNRRCRKVRRSGHPGLLQTQDPRTHMHEPGIEATAGRDVSSVRVRRPPRLDRDLSDVELDVHGATERLPRLHPGPQL